MPAYLRSGGPLDPMKGAWQLLAESTCAKQATQRSLLRQLLGAHQYPIQLRLSGVYSATSTS
eukprot:486836-Pyramimonas_sp.AAC.1